MSDIKTRITKLVFEKHTEILKELPERLEVGLHELLCECIEERINSHCDERLNQTLVNISKSHQIALGTLLRDIPKWHNKKELCRGIVRESGCGKTGSRCSYNAGANGYCNHHQKQAAEFNRCLPKSKDEHNHGPEKMRVTGCPGCERKFWS